MTATNSTVVGYVTRKFLRGIAVVIMLAIYGAGLVGITAATSVATSTEAKAWHRGRRGRRGRWRGRRGRWWGRRGRRGWWGYPYYYGPGFHIWIR
jgi:hypothetical protein